LTGTWSFVSVLMSGIRVEIKFMKISEKQPLSLQLRS